MKENYFLAKWLEGELTKEELLKHISTDELRSYKKIISTSKNLKSPDFYTEETLEKIKLKYHKSKVKKLFFTKYIYRVAAMLAVIITSYYFISNRETSYSTQLAEKINFELPDKSKVNLNADSEIVYKSKNWKSKRVLNLKGEAYFNVKKGSKFKVNTDLGSVQVLGTQFNVIVRDTYFEVNCYEGIVSVQYNSESYKLAAGNSFKVLNTKSELISIINQTTPSWLQNKSSFKSMPYKYVIKELERQFNIEIDYDLKNEDTLFTGSFTHNNLEMALQAISIPLNLKFTKINNKKVSLQ